MDIQTLSSHSLFQFLYSKCNKLLFYKMESLFGKEQPKKILIYSWCSNQMQGTAFYTQPLREALACLPATPMGVRQEEVSSPGTEKPYPYNENIFY